MCFEINTTFGFGLNSDNTDLTCSYTILMSKTAGIMPM